MKRFLTLIALALVSTSVMAVTWTQQEGQFNKYDKTPSNKTDTSWGYAAVADVETVNPSWLKLDGLLIQCKSEGGSYRYFPEGYDCATGKQKVVIGVPVIPPTDAIMCAGEGQTCNIPTGLKATVWYGADTKWAVKENVVGSVVCGNDAFGDPNNGVGKKCVYKTGVVTIPTVPTVPTDPTPVCEAFVCKDDSGVTFDLTKNGVLSCPRVKVTKEQMIMIYDGLQVNQPPCVNTVR